MHNTDLLADYLDRHEAAKALNCHWRTLLRYESQPDGLPSVIIAGRKYYPIAELRAFIARRIRRPNQRAA